jgi:hypothetical protein
VCSDLKGRKPELGFLIMRPCPIKNYIIQPQSQPKKKKKKEREELNNANLSFLLGFSGLAEWLKW